MPNYCPYTAAGLNVIFRFMVPNPCYNPIQHIRISFFAEPLRPAKYLNSVSFGFQKY